MSQNDGPGVRLNERARASIMRQVTEVDGHWIWTGKVNYAGSPIMPGSGGDVVSASENAYHIFRRIVRPPTAYKRCNRALCVNPACWEERLPERPSAPKKKRLKERCIRDHDYSETRRRGVSGRTYCSECEKEKAKARWARMKAENDG